MKSIATSLGWAVVLVWASQGSALGASLLEGDGLAGGIRWDTSPREVDGNERSLDGGLRFSVQGGSYEAYRDLFTWYDQAPPLNDFQQLVEQSFLAWTVADPASGLGTDLWFVADFDTEVVGPEPQEEVDPAGAEIDLLGYHDAYSWDEGEVRRRGEAGIDHVPGPVTLTSGTAEYDSEAISGADIKLNSNPEAIWTPNIFRLVLTHEIGHAIGLADVDVAGPEGRFIDDNYDGSSAESATATLTNSWAHLVDPANPAESPLSLYEVANDSPGFDSKGADILMETSIPTAVLEAPTMLQNDDFGGRQFLYPARHAEIAGDYTGDGVVDTADYEFWKASYGQSGLGLAADGNGNHLVDAGDYIIWRNLQQVSVPVEQFAVPEPSTLGLAIICLLVGGASYGVGDRPPFRVSQRRATRSNTHAWKLPFDTPAEPRWRRTNVQASARAPENGHNRRQSR